MIQALGAGSTVPGIDRKSILGITFPFPPVLEQNKIVEELEIRLSLCNNVNKDLQQNIKHAKALRQSILRTSFEGKLVPQDPNDEPADVLLEKLKQEKSIPNYNSVISKRNKPDL